MHEQRVPRDNSVQRQIVENARIASGAVLVLLTRLDPATGQILPAFWSDPDSELAKSIIHGPENPAASLDASPSTTASDKPCHQLETVYCAGTPVLAKIEDATEGCPNAGSLRSAAAAAGIRYVFICPLKVWGRVEGALSFFARRRPGDEKLRVYEVFVRQSALTLESAVLCDVLQVQLDHIERGRRQLAEADERLRREVSELLGSRVQTRLTVIWHRLGQCQSVLKTDPDEALALLEEARTLVDALRETEIKDASCRLHPSIVQMGLVPSLRSIAATYEEYFEVSVQVAPQLLDVDGPLDSAIPEELRLTAYRVLDEALRNVQRHAAATLVKLSLGIDSQSRLEMVVRDNGCGFDTNTVEPGLGLNILGVRVDQAAGTWRIASEPGRGTVLTLTFPLDRQT